MKISAQTPKFTALLFLLVLLCLSACSSEPIVISPSNPPNFSQAKVFINQVAFDLQGPKSALIALPTGELANRFIV